MNNEPSSPPEKTSCGCSSPTPCEDPKKATRREFMLKLGFGLNAIAGAAVGIPLLGYVFSYPSGMVPDMLMQRLLHEWCSSLFWC
jgi:hypothetical protein